MKGEEERWDRVGNGVVKGVIQLFLYWSAHLSKHEDKRQSNNVRVILKAAQLLMITPAAQDPAQPLAPTQRPAAKIPPQKYDVRRRLSPPGKLISAKRNCSAQHTAPPGMLIKGSRSSIRSARAGVRQSRLVTIT